LLEELWQKSLEEGMSLITSNCAQNHKIFNETHIEQYVGADEDAKQEIFNLFLEEAEKLKATLMSSLELKDFEQTRFNAHKLKSSCSSVGAIALANTCKDLENFAQTNELSIFEQSNIEKFENICAQTFSEIIRVLGNVK
jgi:HPt (histidine-containing phosphotransfer) domain-containing protein